MEIKLIITIKTIFKIKGQRYGKNFKNIFGNAPGYFRLVFDSIIRFNGMNERTVCPLLDAVSDAVWIFSASEFWIIRLNFGNINRQNFLWAFFFIQKIIIRNTKLDQIESGERSHTIDPFGRIFWSGEFGPIDCGASNRDIVSQCKMTLLYSQDIVLIFCLGKKNQYKNLLSLRKWQFQGGEL